MQAVPSRRLVGGAVMRGEERLTLNVSWQLACEKSSLGKAVNTCTSKSLSLLGECLHLLPGSDGSRPSFSDLFRPYSKDSILGTLPGVLS